MKKIIYSIILATLIVAQLDAYSQQTDKNLEKQVRLAITRAYPSCIKMFGFDTLSNQQTSGQFSGVVVTSDGHILTAAHVTTPGQSYKVIFPDGNECIAIALGKIELASDKTRPDVAMMKIITKGQWPYTNLGNSFTLKLNAPCISIAYPESLYQPKPTVRFGYVANVLNDRGFIQSTCIMEPGDSGGPLFDLSGNVIGLHSAIETAENLNYEVPVNLYKKYWKALTVKTVYTALPDSAGYTGKLNGTTAGHPAAVPGPESFLKPSHQKKNNACVVVMSSAGGKTEKILGTLFSLRGIQQLNKESLSIVVSKSTMVGNDPVIIIGDKKIKATVITRDRENDLVLLKPRAEIEGGINVKTIGRDPLSDPTGNFLISRQAGKKSVIGIAGSGYFSIPKMHGAGFLGAAIAYHDSTLKIMFLQPNSPAMRAGITNGDEVREINGVPLTKGEDYGRELQKFWPGDTVNIALSRAGQILIKNIVLDTVPQRAINHPAELFAGGKSRRRDGFLSVFAHDAILSPDMCGGPVYDLNGTFYGINIARYSRAVCLSIPANVLLTFINYSLNKK